MLPSFGMGASDRQAAPELRENYRGSQNTVTEGAGLWGRLATCGGLVTRLRAPGNAVQRRLPTGAQDTILPHKPPKYHHILRASINGHKEAKGVCVNSTAPCPTSRIAKNQDGSS
jgi:hypothetical protein